ncbi:hypothetical protein [Alicyclobacillus herbarius]|uniref:hypothetical protein n=1 Tax=Alicyclobacillus herbarius TaxID=122960 RepID=UPI000403BF07|nr:hypothetical protein [Alicyclobacillus herbarius]
MPNPNRMDVTIERVFDLAGCEACQRIASSVWGAHVACSTPQMLVHAKYGGVVLLAKVHQDPVGFLFSFPTVYRERLVLWSHETAVLSEWRHAGIGAHLKRTQYQLARELGYPAIAWTYDPLVARNAHFNLNKLGARIEEYLVNAYGVDPSDRINQGLETDRFIAVWEITPAPPTRPLPALESPADPRVQTREANPSCLHERAVSAPTSFREPISARLLSTADETGQPVLDETLLQRLASADEPTFRADRAQVHRPAAIQTQIPSDFSQCIASHPEAANAWRHAFRQAAQALFLAGYRPQAFRSGAKPYYTWALVCDTPKVAAVIGEEIDSRP